MIKIENTDIVGLEHAIRGARNAMNSWAKSDSSSELTGYCVGKNDHDLMMRLSNAGTDHRKFMRMIVVYADIIAPLYWWKEYDTYKIGTVANSCSTMHKIADKEFTLDDFSYEHLVGDEDVCWRDNIMEGPYDDYTPLEFLKQIVGALNTYREKYLYATKNKLGTVLPAKELWWQMIQLLPSSYNQKRTVMLNYEVLANIYKSRKNHKLDEWHDFCDWIETLQYSELITGEDNGDTVQG